MSAGAVLSAVGGALILLDGLLLAAGITASPLGYASLDASGAALGALSGILVIAGARMMSNPARARYGALITLCFALAAFFAGGGFLIGSLIGLLGAILGFLKK